MAIGKISGAMLQTNLARQGVDLSVDSDLLYLDVTNRRVGVNNSAPTQTLDVEGNVRLGNLSVLGNSIVSDTGKVDLGSISNVTITGGSVNYVISTDGTGNLSWSQISDLDFTFGNLSFNDTTVQVTRLNANLVLAANGTGYIDANAAVVTNAGYPVGVTDLVTKGYIDDTFAGFNDDQIVSGNTQVLATSSNVTVIVNDVLQAYYTPTNSVINQVSITDATVSSLSGDLHLAPLTNSDKIVFNNTSSITIPVGNDSDRPATPVTGDFRFNTSSSSLEYWNGTGWLGTSVNLDSQTIYADGSSDTFTLNNETTTNGVLVSINGTLQQPTLAYTVNGTDITFVEVPASTDVIEVRYIALAVTPSINTTVVDTANVAVSTTTAILDSMSINLYRSAKYYLQLTAGTDYQFVELHAIHNGATANISTVSNTSTNGNLATFSANVSSGSLNLLVTASGSTVTRLQKTYFLI
jgi:hypothetical protein